MQPQPVLLYRRRWTLYFSVPFTVLLALTTAYTLFLAAAFNSRPATILLSFLAFCTFCITWTVGRSAWDAYQHREPALIIDANGILDLRDEDPEPLPWEAMEHVSINYRAEAIVVRLRHRRHGAVTQALVRWYHRGDVAFRLRGLGHNTRLIEDTLKAYHAAATVPASPSL